MLIFIVLLTAIIEIYQEHGFLSQEQNRELIFLGFGDFFDSQRDRQLSTDIGLN